MSGIVGIVNRDGAPVEPARVERLTAFLAFRGADGQQTWCDGAVGFGAALLRLGNGASPALVTSDDLAIVADAHLVDRGRLT